MVLSADVVRDYQQSVSRDCALKRAMKIISMKRKHAMISNDPLGADSFLLVNRASNSEPELYADEMAIVRARRVRAELSDCSCHGAKEIQHTRRRGQNFKLMAQLGTGSIAGMEGYAAACHKSTCDRSRAIGIWILCGDDPASILG